eukprot:gene11165-23333_t
MIFLLKALVFSLVHLGGFSFKSFPLKSINIAISRSNLKMVSVGGGPPRPQPPPRQNSFIISPRSNTAETEMLILDNFSQIQLGEVKRIGIIGTQDLSPKHRQMIELLSYALVLSGNHVFTSGGGNGTNMAVIKGALRACNSDLLTVILPQTISRQPEDIQPLLLRVANLLEQPQYNDLGLKEAANLCNMKIISMVDEIMIRFYFEKCVSVITSKEFLLKLKSNVLSLLLPALYSSVDVSWEQMYSVCVDEYNIDMDGMIKFGLYNL